METSWRKPEIWSEKKTINNLRQNGLIPIKSSKKKLQVFPYDMICAKNMIPCGLDIMRYFRWDLKLKMRKLSTVELYISRWSA